MKQKKAIKQLHATQRQQSNHVNRSILQGLADKTVAAKAISSIKKPIRKYERQLVLLQALEEFLIERDCLLVDKNVRFFSHNGVAGIQVQILMDASLQMDSFCSCCPPKM